MFRCFVYDSATTEIYEHRHTLPPPAAIPCSSTSTQVVVDLKCPPMQIFDEIPPAHSNYIRLRLSPEVVISTGVRVKRAGDDMQGEDVELTARPQHADEKSPYERLPGDAIRGARPRARLGGKESVRYVVTRGDQ